MNNQSDRKWLCGACDRYELGLEPTLKHTPRCPARRYEDDSAILALRNAELMAQKADLAVEVGRMGKALECESCIRCPGHDDITTALAKGDSDGQ